MLTLITWKGKLKHFEKEYVGQKFSKIQKNTKIVVEKPIGIETRKVTKKNKGTVPKANVQPV